MPAKKHTLNSQKQHLQEPRGLWGLLWIRKLRVPIHSEDMSVSFQRSILLRDVNAHRILHTTVLQEQTETTQAETHRYHRNTEIGKAILDQPVHLHLPIELCPSVPQLPSAGTPPGTVLHYWSALLWTCSRVSMSNISWGELKEFSSPLPKSKTQLSGRWQRKIG